MVFPDLLFLLRERLPAFCGLRMVAMTRPPCSAKYRVVSQPMPEDAPRIKYETILDHIRQPMPATRFFRCRLRKPRSIWCGTVLESEYRTETLAAGHAKYPVNLEITFEIGLFANDLNDLTPTAAQFVQSITHDQSAG